MTEKPEKKKINYPHDMTILRDLVMKSEEWLMARILNYAKLHDYTKYTSTLMEAWRLSISGLSGSLVMAINEGADKLELSPDNDYSSDPVSAFGVLEAKRHRERGVELSMFIGLMKYYRQSYTDLIEQAGFDSDYGHECRLIIDRFFDRIEIGFCVEWAFLTENEKTRELQSKNRKITNEKNKYLTIFETIHDPVILLDENNRVENVNHAWAELFEDVAVPGSLYYLQNPEGKQKDKITVQLISLIDAGKNENAFKTEIETKKGNRFFHVKIKRMLDVSDKYKGTVIILSDISDLKKAEEEKLKKEKLQGVLEMAGAVCHEINQPLQVVLGQSQLLEMDVDETSPFHERVNTILNHVEKLGAITAKLAGITRYETKAYFKSKIIDIDKASEKEEMIP